MINMIKKTKWILCGVVIILLGAIMFFLNINRVDTTIMHNGMVQFVYIDKHVSTKMKTEDERYIKELFNNRQLYRDDPSCGFSTDVSISFDNGKNVFCIAEDSCPIIYYKQRNKYFQLSEKDILALHKVLEKYGFTFPCV